MRYLIATWLLAILPPTRWFGMKRVLLRALGLSIGDNAYICGRVAFFGGGRVIIGRNSWIGIGSTFYTAAGGDITIGDDCDIAPECCFHAGSHEIGPPERRAGAGIAASITIGDGCWIGLRATILPGVAIGAGSVVGAGSLVTGSQPGDSLILGAPARVTKPLPR